jgi:hypothetical protein
MASTYSNSGIELIANGEQSATWGDTTNTNLEIIDRIINGVGTISLSGTTHTLTTSDGALSDGHYRVLVFGGSPSGTNTVTIEPNNASHVYFVVNNSGQSVVLTQGSGGDVTIADGRTAAVYCNGGGASAAVVNLSDTYVASTVSDIGSLTPTDGNFLVGNGTTWVVETGNTALTSLGVTATTGELNLLDGVTWTLANYNTLTASAAELNYSVGVTSAIQTQLNAKAPIAGPTFTGTVTIPTAAVTTANITTSNVTTANITTANVTTVDLGDWTITESAGVLYFATGGTNKMKLDATGNLTVTGDVTAYGTI